ncbi:MAG: hypothetical protein IKZ45_09230 [Fibrobacter sp.]|nr:hypothetical protein [Fibrobacter sp.]
MKKNLATAAALSLMLIACGDETSSTAPDQQAAGGKKTNASSNYHPGECRTDIPCARNFDGVAYLISGESDGYQVVVPFVQFPNSASIDGDFFSERSGDTLYIWDEQKESDETLAMPQPCVADLVFDISAEDADIKFFKYFDDVYEVVPGPVPTSIFRCPPPPGEKSSSSGVEPSSSEIPSSSDTPSSSGAESSSSEKPSSSAAGSSSSVAAAVDLHHVITDADGQCGTKREVDDPMLDGISTDRFVGGDEKIPPVAYRYVGTERTGFSIENISITCGLVVDTLDVNVSGDTVYVNATFDRTNAQRCMCDFKIDFAVDNAEAYSHAKVLVFDEAPGNTATPTIMEIVNMDVITVEEAVGYRQAKDIDLMCKNDRQTARAFTAASNTLLPGKIDTTETAPVAARVVGNEGFDTIIISEVTMPCEIVFESFDVHASNGKLYVEPKVDPDSPITNCICPTRVTFKIEKNEAFSNTNYLVFDGGEPMPLVNSKPVSALELDGFQRGQCLDNALSSGAKALTKSVTLAKAEEELPQATLTTYMNGLTVLEMHNVNDYCGMEAKVSQKVVGDTLFLDYYDMTAVTKCLCTFDSHEFVIEPENTGARFAKFKDVLYMIVQVHYTVDPNWKE